MQNNLYKMEFIHQVTKECLTGFVLKEGNKFFGTLLGDEVGEQVPLFGTHILGVLIDAYVDGNELITYDFFSRGLTDDKLLFEELITERDSAVRVVKITHCDVNKGFDRNLAKSITKRTEFNFRELLREDAELHKDAIRYFNGEPAYQKVRK